MVHRLSCSTRLGAKLAGSSPEAFHRQDPWSHNFCFSQHMQAARFFRPSCAIMHSRACTRIGRPEKTKKTRGKRTETHWAGGELPILTHYVINYYICTQGREMCWYLCYLCQAFCFLFLETFSWTHPAVARVHPANTLTH